MRDVFGVCVFDPEVVDDETEFNGACFVLPESGGDRAFGVSMRFQDFDELVDGNSSGLWQAIHAFPYFDVYVPVMDEWLSLLDQG
mmetsp:Transcript_13267/g.19087  ORF Transcript_13267/g.19087 Transcript_13267/m.19087 type:complete len:85 (-) Transcript_13267:141-395(-)